MAKSPAVNAVSKAAAAKKAAVIAKAKPIAEQAAPAVEVSEEQRVAERRANAAMNFSVTQMSQPPAQPLLQSPVVDPKQAAFAAAVAALAAQHGIEAPTFASKAPRPPKDTKNGITRPHQNTTCGKIWGAADAVSAAQGGAPATIAQLKVHTAVALVNDHTLKTQYARWRKYNGVTGRVAAPVAAAQPATPWNPPFGDVPAF